MSDLINTKGIDPADLLAALYNASQPQGMGFLHFNARPMTRDEARDILDQHRNTDGSCYFDYLKGRVMKVLIKGTTLDSRLYDRDNGPGAAQRVVESLRARKES